MSSRSSPHPPSRSKSDTTNSSSTLGSSKPISYSPRCTPEEYVKAISHHSQQSSAETLYPGEIYHFLKTFLEERSSTSIPASGCTSHDYAWLISPSRSAEQALADKSSLGGGNRSQERHEGFTDPDACIEALKSNIESSHPQVLFLRGHPTPDWLSSIGAFCQVDPELFRWFLRYCAEPGSDHHFDSAPSLMSNIFRFTFFTIGSKNYRRRSSQQEVNLLRAKAAREFQRYQAQLRSSWVLKPGDSIVRNFHVLDERDCILEQEITVSIFDIGKTWIAIACTDAGNDLSQGPRLPWLGDGDPLPVTLLPIVQYRPRCALKSRGLSQSHNATRKGRNMQSLAIFPEGYGRGLDWSLAKSDRFQVLSDLFRLAAFSQKQLLNVMRDKIATETNPLLVTREIPTLANLLHFRDILQDQLSNVSYMLKLTDDQNKVLQSSRRPSVILSTDLRNPTERSLAEVFCLFQDLQAQAQSLQEKCTQGMTVISNNSMLAESQRAIKQAKLVTKLTLVAFVYLPFTFTAGFFGMNFQELGTGTIPLWIFFAASLPLMLVTVAFFALDIQTIKLRWRSMVNKGWDKT